jgi:hypothetical protein
MSTWSPFGSPPRQNNRACKRDRRNWFRLRALQSLAVPETPKGILEQVPRLDLPVAVDQRGGHLLGEDVQREHAFLLEIGQHTERQVPGLDARSVSPDPSPSAPLPATALPCLARGKKVFGSPVGPVRLKCRWSGPRDWR